MGAELLRLEDTSDLDEEVQLRRGQALGFNATRFAEDGMIKPRIQVATINFPWRISDGVALVEELLEIAQPVAPTNTKWEGIQQAKKRTGLRVGKIIEALRNGEFQLGHYTNVEGYAGFCVWKTEINSMRRPKLKVSDQGLITASAFGRSVGIRASGWFKKLAAEGIPLNPLRHTRREVLINHTSFPTTSPSFTSAF